MSAFVCVCAGVGWGWGGGGGVKWATGQTLITFANLQVAFILINLHG